MNKEREQLELAAKTLQNICKENTRLRNAGAEPRSEA